VIFYVGNLVDGAFPIRTGRKTFVVCVCGVEKVLRWVEIVTVFVAPFVAPLQLNHSIVTIERREPS
jgi:hypothetical protein